MKEKIFFDNDRIKPYKKKINLCSNIINITSERQNPYINTHTHTFLLQYALFFFLLCKSGNEVLHQLTMREPQVLRVDAEDFNGSRRWGIWSRFRVDDEAHK